MSVETREFTCSLCGAEWRQGRVWASKPSCERCEALVLIDLELLRVQRFLSVLKDLNREVHSIVVNEAKIIRRNEIEPRVGFKFPATGTPPNPEGDAG